MEITRRDARDLAFSLIYEYSFYSEKDAATYFEERKGLRELPEDNYLHAVVVGAIENSAREDELIEKYSNGWKVKRISRVSLAIMRLCIYEMLFVEDIPYNVSINEAIELCKKYNDDKAPAFVNGILNAIAEKEGLK